MAGLVGDLRYTLRVLARSPGFTAVATLSLALGIGANATIFGTIESVLRDPLAVVRPDELRVVYWRRDGDLGISQIASGSYTDPAGASWRTNFSLPLYRAMRDASPDERLFAFNFIRAMGVAVGGEPPVLAGGLLVDGDFFGVLSPASRSDAGSRRPMTRPARRSSPCWGTRSGRACSVGIRRWSDGRSA